MSGLQSKIDRITNILRRDDGISGAMHYTEQISWILFLKFLSDFEENKCTEAELEGSTYDFVIDQEHRWQVWACPKDEEGKLDVKKALTGDDLTHYVNTQLFPYLQDFKNNSTADLRSIRYKIGAIFEYLDNRIASGHTLREVIDIIDSLDFQSQTELFELSHIYENLLKGMGSDGGNSGEFYTPRAVVQAMVQVIDPQIGDTIYDGAAGSCGFLVEAYEYMTSPEKRSRLSTNDWRTLQADTFYGNEKTPLAYVMGVMNMILHGVDSPNIYKQNTLTLNIRDIQEKDRYSVILANPPFGGKEKSQIQQNFPVQSNSTELLFLQHFMKTLKVGGRAAIIVPEGVLFQTNSAFKAVKQELLENFNLHTIVSLPSGVFLPYSGVKTNIIFFERTGATSDIWYYEVNPPIKLTKNKPIATDHLREFITLYSSRTASDNSWCVNIADVIDYDLSAKNPKRKQDIDHLLPVDIMMKLKSNDSEIQELIKEVELILAGGYGEE